MHKNLSAKTFFYPNRRKYLLKIPVMMPIEVLKKILKYENDHEEDTSQDNL